MNRSFREQITHFVSTNQSVVAGSTLFAVAFGVFAMNATFNQPGNHPLPLWSKPQNIVTNSVTVPVRRVETTRISAAKIPVPRLRPVAVLHEQEKLLPDHAGEFASDLPVDATQVQRLLSHLGFYSGPLDGMVGLKTQAAIRQFERSKFLPESGNASPALLLLLESTIEAGLKKPSETATENEPVQTDKNTDAAMITRIQVGLINFGLSDVSIDGVMGNQTSQAIVKFQRKFSMKIDGRASSELVEKLESVGALTKG